MSEMFDLNRDAINAALELLSEELPLIGMFAWWKDQQEGPNGERTVTIAVKLDVMRILDEDDAVDMLTVTGQAIRDEFADFQEREKG